MDPLHWERFLENSSHSHQRMLQESGGQFDGIGIFIVICSFECSMILWVALSLPVIVCLLGSMGISTSPISYGAHAPVDDFRCRALCDSFFFHAS